MSALTEKIFSLTAGEVRKLLPEPLIHAGKGLVMTGDVLNLHWSDDEAELLLSFPKRLSHFRCRISLKEGALHSECGCGLQHPCPHFAAGLMLCVHLLQSDNSFGRFGSSYQLDAFTQELLKASSSRASETKKKIQKEVAAQRRVGKHIRIVPEAMRLFNYMESGDAQKADPYAVVPEEVRSFAGIWAMGQYAEKQFWQWFSNPNQRKQRLPVYIEANNELRLLEPGERQHLKPEFAISLEGGKVTYSQLLLEKDKPVSDEYTVLTNELIWFHESDTVVHVPNNHRWQLWSQFVDEVTGYFPECLSADASRMELSFTEFNRLGMAWNSDAGSFPLLYYKGQQVVKPPKFSEKSFLHLLSIPGQELLRVELFSSVADVQHQYAHAVAYTENLLQHCAADGALLAAKSRFGSLCEMLWQVWLTPRGKERTALLKTLKDAAGFRTARQVKSGTLILKQLLSELGKPLQFLLASPEHGWICTQDVQESASALAALARWVLGVPW
jgi:hypothetical protein